MQGEVLIAVVGASSGVLSSFIAVLATLWVTRRKSADDHKRLETEQSGEWKLAELAERAEFRQLLRAELDSVREDNRAMRAELVEAEARCETKIRDAVARSEEHCAEQTNRKLASQAIQIRGEYEPRLADLERQVRDISEPMMEAP